MKVLSLSRTRFCNRNPTTGEEPKQGEGTRVVGAALPLCPPSPAPTTITGSHPESRYKEPAFRAAAFMRKNSLKSMCVEKP